MSQVLLRRWPEVGNIEGGAIRLSWLKNDFKVLTKDAFEHIIQCYAHAYILRLLGHRIMLDKTSTLVHAKYLPLLTHLEQVSRYS